MKAIRLPGTPYAAGWKTEGVVPKSNAEITELGRRYAEMAEGEGKKELLLELCQAFHPLLMKYLVMICPVPAAQKSALTRKGLETR